MAASNQAGYFLIATFLAALALRANAGDIRWDPPSVEVKQGEELTMKCIVENIKFMDIVRLVKENEGEEAHQITISDMHHLKPPFKDISRYSVHVEKSIKDKTITATLTFTGVRGEDAGRLGCMNLADDTVVAWADLKVLVPINDMYIARRDEQGHETRAEEGDMVDLRENKDNAIVCNATVNGSMTPPTLRVLVDGEDKTALFTAQPKSNTLTNDGLPTYYSEMALVYDNQKPEASFNGKTLICEGEMEGFDKRKVSAILAVEYAPIVTCSKYEHYAILGSSITLGCDVQSNPPASISWAWGKGKSIISGQTDEPNHIAAEELPLKTSDQKQANLAISKVRKSHLGPYILTATNEYGTKAVTLELKRASAKPKPKPKPSTDSAQKSSGTAPEPQVVTGGAPQASVILWTLLVSLPLFSITLITVT